MIKCDGIAIGFIVRPDGYRCELCEYHWRIDWEDAIPPDGYTLGRFPIAQREESRTCQRMRPAVEVHRWPVEKARTD